MPSRNGENGFEEMIDDVERQSAQIELTGPFRISSVLVLSP